MALGAALMSTAAQADRSGDDSLEISERRSIKFGMVAGSSDGPGTAILSPSGALTTTGYAIAISGTVCAGEFEVQGPDNAEVIITLPSSVTISKGSSTVTLSNFTSSPSGTATLNRRGRLTITVGATLSLPANQAAGEYEGTFPIYVDLQ